MSNQQQTPKFSFGQTPAQTPVAQNPNPLNVSELKTPTFSFATPSAGASTGLFGAAKPANGSATTGTASGFSFAAPSTVLPRPSDLIQIPQSTTWKRLHKQLL